MLRLDAASLLVGIEHLDWAVVTALELTVQTCRAQRTTPTTDNESHNYAARQKYNTVHQIIEM